MTDVPPPESPKPPRGRPRRPKGYDDEAVLSEEEVARRVDVRGGGTPRAPIERAPVRAPRTPPRRPQRTGARDSLLLIGLVIVGLVAVRLFLPDGPLTASATSSPQGTQAAVASIPPTATLTTTPTGGLITLPPTAFVPTPTPGPVTEPPATQPPAPTPTLRPGQTPAPTPKPTKTPAPTKTPPPGSPTMLVTLTVVNDNGGTATASDWTIFTNQPGSNPASFTSSSSGTTVTMLAGTPYQISENAKTAEGDGYTAVRSAHCGTGTGGLLSAGQSVTCTIVMNDRPVRLRVVTVVNGGSQSPSDWSVSVDGPALSPSSFNGSSSGVTVTADAHSSFDVSMTNSTATDYDLNKTGTCTSSGLAPGATPTCTFTYTYNPPPPPPTDTPPPGPLAGLVVPLLWLPSRWIPRRWRSTQAG